MTDSGQPQKIVWLWNRMQGRHLPYVYEWDGHYWVCVDVSWRGR